MEILSKSPRETQKVALDLSRDIKLGDIVALYGELGAGKTVFIQGLAKGLGIKKNITSPTFVFMRSYLAKIGKKNTNFYHLDLYRGEKNYNFEDLGLDEIINSRNIVVLEWAAKIKGRLPKKRIDVRIISIDENTRKITINRS